MELDLTPIVKRAEEAQKPEAEDYIGADGFLYCGKCHTPRQCKTHFFGITYCLCKCRTEARERERMRQAAEVYRRNCFSTPAQYAATFETDKGYHPQITAALKRYVEAFPTLRRHGTGILLYGEFGTGKSHLAYEVANALIDRLYPVKVAQLEELYRSLEQERNKNAFLSGLSRYALVVLDDLGAEKKSSTMQSFVFDVIDTLYRARTPFLITTNLSIEELKKPPDDANRRIYERILERCPAPIAVERVDGSIRRQIVREEHAEYKKLLGL